MYKKIKKYGILFETLLWLTHSETLHDKCQYRGVNFANYPYFLLMGKKILKYKSMN